MRILKEKEVRRRERAPRDHELVNELGATERANVIAALNVMHIRLGTWQAVAKAMSVTPRVVENAVARKRKPSAGLAIRVARLAGVSVDDVLSGAFPKPGSCPMCGRCE